MLRMNRIFLMLALLPLLVCASEVRESWMRQRTGWMLSIDKVVMARCSMI